jgi:hypothetical protein
LLPFSIDVFMSIVGVVEFVVGISILTALPVVGAYVASAWLILIAVNLTLGGYFDIAVRDVVLSIGAFTLARLIQVRDQVETGEVRPARRGIDRSRNARLGWLVHPFARVRSRWL